MPVDPNQSNETIAAYLQRIGVGLGHAQATDDPWEREDWTHHDVEDFEREPSQVPFELDDRSFVRWVQSILRASVEPSLIIDGRMGSRTRLAIQRFQVNAPSLGVRGGALAPTGTLDAMTLAALQAVAGVRSPGGSPTELNAEGQPTFVAGGYLLSHLRHNPNEGPPSTPEGSVVALGGDDVRILVDGRSRTIVGRVPLTLGAGTPEPAPPARTPLPPGAAPGPVAPPIAMVSAVHVTAPLLLHVAQPSVVTHSAISAAAPAPTPTSASPAVAHSATPISASVVKVKPQKMIVAQKVEPVLLKSGAQPVRFTKRLSGQPLTLSATMLEAKPVVLGTMALKVQAKPVLKSQKPTKKVPQKGKWYLSEVLTKVSARGKELDLRIDRDALIRALDRSIRDRFVGIGDQDAPTTPPTGDRPSDETASDQPVVPDASDADPGADAPTTTPEAESTPPPTLALQNVSSYAHWVQSILAATVMPDIAVDGIIGPITRSAIGLFQESLPRLPGGLDALPSTGTLTTETLAALEWVSGTQRPDRPTYAVPDAPPPPVGDLNPAAAEEDLARNGAVWNVIRLGGDEVRFQYHVKERSVPGGATDRDPYNVWSYEGAKTDLLTDADVESAGFSSSGAKILRENAIKESAGKFGAVNTWDNQFVSWGLSQFAGHAGTLASLMAALNEHPQTHAAFQTFFAANGIDVAHGPYPYWDRTKGDFVSRNGWHVVVYADAVHTGDVAWLYMRTQPRLLGALMLAGNSRELQIGQIRFWREKFFDNCRRKRVLDRGLSFSRYVTSELGVGLAARLYNWMPAYLSRWMREVVADMGPEFPGEDLHDPAVWERLPAIETRWIERMRTKRRNAKRGSWDDYGLTLSAQRGSYR